MGRGAETAACGAEWGPKATGCLAACEGPPKPKRTVFKLHMCAVEPAGLVWDQCASLKREWCEVREEVVAGKPSRADCSRVPAPFCGPVIGCA